MLRVAPELAKLLKSELVLEELEEIPGRTVIVKSDAQLHEEKFDLAKTVWATDGHGSTRISNICVHPC
jgi:hypothetical protein